MPYVTATLAGIEALTASGDDEGKGVFQNTAEKVGGIEGARAQRDAISEARGAQRDQLKAAQDKAMADRANEENRALGQALRRRARQSQPGIAQPLGAPLAPQSGAKTLLGM